MDHNAKMAYPTEGPRAKPRPLGDRVSTLEMEVEGLQNQINVLREDLDRITGRFQMFLEVNNLWDGS